MTSGRAVLLGVIQGATEFLPVSSSGHLALARLLGAAPGGDTGQTVAFFLVLHMGTLCAVLWYMRRDILRILFGGQRTLIAPLLLSTGVTAVIAIPLKKIIENSFDSITMIGAGFFFTAFILCAGEIMYRKRTVHRKEVSMATAAVVGLLQAAATFAGVSRSGSTISGGLLCGLDRKSAVRYAFLLAVPAIAGAALFDLPEISGLEWGTAAAAGFSASFLTGLGAIAALMRIVRTRWYPAFAAYTAALGALCIVLRILGIG